MECGVFHTPYMRPGRKDKDTFEYSLLLAAACDKFGYRDFMVGEHGMQAWENIPNPELLIVAAAQITERMRFAPMAHIVPLHNPSTLAIQIGYTSQLLEDRYFLGVGAGSWENEAVLRGQPGDLSEAHPRLMEGLEVMDKVWRQEPFDFEGKYYKAARLDGQIDPGSVASHGEFKVKEGEEYHLTADHSPHGGADGLEIAVTGLSKNSPSHRLAGERGWTPISFYGGSALLRSQWDTYSEAVRSIGGTPQGSRFKIARDVFVAKTDEEAKEKAKSGALGLAWQKYLMPVYQKYRILQGFIDDADHKVDIDDVDLDYLADNVWLCGSPDTVIEKIEKTFDLAGFRYGQLAVNTHDAMDDPEPWIESLRLFATEVVPNVPVEGTHETVAVG
ncbi:LLM class flavin-dependent oxidoreductase [Rhodococcus jostii]|uniref:Flavin-dependent oxidoreductase, luciferase family (Includes alkanesulfonate monooxygenase SsuD and methylene tetrahydromethanopterin reductase) n=1 Tax=Rhodococcus jostii TaxID=132919 RepID=A0A1H5HIN8_RHOJO|nr:LLM class flavin-dependent oxidoreductase [Rhodococcus jostii]SEE27862.1 Flavin-dependent oxidoreductase, luciferase family (includes alkanesulfonate monooxygenase SsuD and methylene tetrahydromethanopterin reductase) [Rhodococcus jostii]